MTGGNTIFEKLRTALLKYVDCEKEDITPETEFLKDLKMTSFDIISLIGQIEEEFDIELDNEKLKEIYTVGDLAKYLSDVI